MRILDFSAENEKQKSILKDCIDFVRGEYSVGLIMLGKNGTGKSMLSSMILKELIIREPHISLGYGLSSQRRLYTEAIKVIRAIKDTWRNASTISEQDAINRFISPEVLVIDEIGVQYGSDTEAQFLTEIINDRYNQQKRTILCGNLTLPELSNTIGERAIDRFREGGKVLVFDWDGYRGRT